MSALLLDASTAELDANKFVWKAMSSITFIIFDIFSDAVFISDIDISISFISLLPVSALCFPDNASLLVSFVLQTWEIIFDIYVLRASTELDCSVAPCAKVILDSDTYVTPDAICILDESISNTTKAFILSCTKLSIVEFIAITAFL